MDITSEQISACSWLVFLEDQYLEALNTGTDRTELEPLRKTIQYMQTEYDINDEIRSLYDKYTRLVRAQMMYGDVLKNLQDRVERTNEEPE